MARCYVTNAHAAFHPAWHL